MVFAAGFGTRLQNYTQDMPKPLLKVKERCLIDIVLDRLFEYGIEKVVVNCHYQAQHLIKHLQGKEKVIISYEQELLDTGGGLLKALTMIGNEPLITVNADTIWYASDLLLQLTDIWQNDTNLAMTFYHAEKMLNYIGEFQLLPTQQVIQHKNGEYVYAGIQIINPALLHKVNKKVFSLSELYDMLFAQEIEKVYGLAYEGEIFHIGTPQELELANI